VNDRSGLSAICVAGVTSGVAAASVNIAARFTTDPGDVLGFTGGVVGAGLAVLGALFVENRKAQLANVANQLLVSQSLISVVVSTIHLAKADRGLKWSRLLAVRQSFDGYVALRRALPFPEPQLNIRLTAIEDWMVRWRVTIDRLLAELEDEVDASQVQCGELITLSRQISIMARWVIGRPSNWPKSVQCALSDMHDDADANFPDRLTRDYEMKQNQA